MVVPVSRMLEEGMEERFIKLGPDMRIDNGAYSSDGGLTGGPGF